MKSKKMYKSIVAIALVCVMLVMCMGAGYSGESTEKDMSALDSQYSSADLFWSDGGIENLVSLEKTNQAKNDTSNLQFEHDIDIIDEDLGEAHYSLNIINKNVDIINAYGQLDHVIFDNEISAYCGTLRGDCIIDDDICKVFANVDYNPVNGDLFSSITIQPTDGGEESAHFSVGTSFVTKDMWSARVDGLLPSTEYGEVADRFLSNGNLRNSGYLLRGSSFDGNINLDVYYNKSEKRVAVVTEADSSSVFQRYVDANFYSVRTQVKKFKTGLKRNSYNSSSIINIDSFPQSSTQSAFNNFLNSCDGLLSDLGVPSVLIDILKNISKAPTSSMQTTGSHTWGSMSFSAGPGTEQVLFDNGPFAVAYNMTTTQSGTFEYTGYTDIEYLSICVPAYSSAQLRYTDTKSNEMSIWVDLEV